MKALLAIHFTCLTANVNNRPCFTFIKLALGKNIKEFFIHRDAVIFFFVSPLFVWWKWSEFWAVWQDTKLLCLFLRIKFTFLVLSTSPSSLTLSVTRRRAVMSCSCPAAATSSRTGTASVAPLRNGLTLSFQVNMHWLKVIQDIAGTPERNSWWVKHGCSWDV